MSTNLYLDARLFKGLSVRNSIKLDVDLDDDITQQDSPHVTPLKGEKSTTGVGAAGTRGANPTIKCPSPSGEQRNYYDPAKLKIKSGVSSSVKKPPTPPGLTKGGDSPLLTLHGLSNLIKGDDTPGTQQGLGGTGNPKPPAAAPAQPKLDAAPAPAAQPPAAPKEPLSGAGKLATAPQVKPVAQFNKVEGGNINVTSKDNQFHFTHDNGEQAHPPVHFSDGLHQSGKSVSIPPGIQHEVSHSTADLHPSWKDPASKGGLHDVSIKTVPHEGGKYTGEVNSAGQPHGQGATDFGDGRVYEGNHHEGKRHGIGTLKDNSGGSLSGSWKNDRPHGEMTRKFPGGGFKTEHYDSGNLVTPGGSKKEDQRSKPAGDSKGKDQRPIHELENHFRELGGSEEQLKEMARHVGKLNHTPGEEQPKPKASGWQTHSTGHATYEDAEAAAKSARNPIGPKEEASLKEAAEKPTPYSDPRIDPPSLSGRKNFYERKNIETRIRPQKDGTFHVKSREVEDGPSDVDPKVDEAHRNMLLNTIEGITSVGEENRQTRRISPEPAAPPEKLADTTTSDAPEEGTPEAPGTEGAPGIKSPADMHTNQVVSELRSHNVPNLDRELERLMNEAQEEIASRPTESKKERTGTGFTEPAGDMGYTHQIVDSYLNLPDYEKTIEDKYPDGYKALKEQNLFEEFANTQRAHQQAGKKTLITPEEFLQKLDLVKKTYPQAFEKTSEVGDVDDIYQNKVRDLLQEVRDQKAQGTTDTEAPGTPFEETDESGFVYRGHRNENGNFHGHYTASHPNGELATEGEFRDGKREGLHTDYHDNKERAYVGRYRDGKPHGLHTEYDENGHKLFEGGYRDGKRHGVHREYHTNGQIKSEREFRDGEQQGDHKHYHEDGSHSHTHVNVANMSPNDVVRELETYLGEEELTALKAESWKESGSDPDLYNEIMADRLESFRDKGQPQPEKLDAPDAPEAEEDALSPVSDMSERELMRELDDSDLVGKLYWDIRSKQSERGTDWTPRIREEFQAGLRDLVERKRAKTREQQGDYEEQPQPEELDAPDTPDTPEADDLEAPEDFDDGRDVNDIPHNELIERVIGDDSVPHDIKETIRDMPGHDANWDDKFSYISRVMNKLAEHQEKNRNKVDWYRLGKAMMALDPFEAVENWYGAFKQTLNSLTTSFVDERDQWRTRKELEESFGMRVPKEISKKTKDIFENSPLKDIHGDVERTVGNTKHWTKAVHENFHRDYDNLLQNYEKDKNENRYRDDNTLNSVYSHAFDQLLRSARISSNADNGRHHAHTTATPENHEDFHKTLIHAIRDTGLDPNVRPEAAQDIVNLANGVRGLSAEHLNELTSVLNNIRDMPPHQREAILKASIIKLANLERTNIDARKTAYENPARILAAGKDQKDLPELEVYDGPQLSDTLKNFLNGLTSPQDVQANAEAAGNAADEQHATNTQTADSVTGVGDSDTGVVDADWEQISGPDTPASLPAPPEPVPAWGEHLADPEDDEADSALFRPELKPEHNVGRGYRDSDTGAGHVIMAHHDDGKGNTSYTVRQINPNHLLGSPDSNHDKFIEFQQDAKKLHNHVARKSKGGYVPDVVGWHPGHSVNSAKEKSAFENELSSLRGDSAKSHKEATRQEQIASGSHEGLDKHYGSPKSRKQYSGVADFGSKTDPRKNVGTGFKNKRDNEEYYISDHFFDEDGERDFYQLEYLTPSGDIEKREIEVAALYGDKDIVGTRVPWHESHIPKGPTGEITSHEWNSHLAARKNHASTRPGAESQQTADAARSAPQAPPGETTPPTGPSEVTSKDQADLGLGDPGSNIPREEGEDEGVSLPPGEEGEKGEERPLPPSTVTSDDAHLRDNVIKAGGTPREDVEVIYSDTDADGVHDSVKTGTIYVGKGMKSLPVKYGLVRIADVLNSHRLVPGATGLISNADKGYPAAAQERKGQYENPAVKDRINSNSQRTRYDEDGTYKGGFLPSAVVDPSHEPNTGPPTITLDGITVGGNERTELIKQLIANGHGDLLVERLKHQAKSLGLDPDKIDDGWMPARVFQKNHHDMSKDELQTLSSDLNAEVSKDKNMATVANNVVNDIKDSFKHLKDFHVDTHTSVTDFINRSEGKPIREALQSAVGVNNSDWFESSGRLTPEGKKTLKNALAVHAMNGNSDLYNFLNSEGVKSQGEKYRLIAPYVLSAPHILNTKDKTGVTGGEKFDLSKELELAADAYKSVIDYQNTLGREAKKTFNSFPSARKLDLVMNPTQLSLLDEGQGTADPHPIKDNPLAQWIYHLMFEGSVGQGEGDQQGENTEGLRTKTGIKDVFKNYTGTLQNRQQGGLIFGDEDASLQSFPESALEALRRAYKEKTGQDAPEDRWGIDSGALEKYSREKSGAPSSEETVEETAEAAPEEETAEAAPAEAAPPEAGTDTTAPQNQEGGGDWRLSERSDFSSKRRDMVNEVLGKMSPWGSEGEVDSGWWEHHTNADREHKFTSPDGDITVTGKGRNYVLSSKGESTNYKDLKTALSAAQELYTKVTAGETAEAAPEEGAPLTRPPQHEVTSAVMSPGDAKKLAEEKGGAFRAPHYTGLNTGNDKAIENEVKLAQGGVIHLDDVENINKKAASILAANLVGNPDVTVTWNSSPDITEAGIERRNGILQIIAQDYGRKFPGTTEDAAKPKAEEAANPKAKDESVEGRFSRLDAYLTKLNEIFKNKPKGAAERDRYARDHGFDTFEEFQKERVKARRKAGIAKASLEEHNEALKAGQERLPELKRIIESEPKDSPRFRAASAAQDAWNRAIDSGLKRDLTAAQHATKNLLPPSGASDSDGQPAWEFNGKPHDNDSVNTISGEGELRKPGTDLVMRGTFKDGRLNGDGEITSKKAGKSHKGVFKDSKLIDGVTTETLGDGSTVLKKVRDGHVVNLDSGKIPSKLSGTLKSIFGDESDPYGDRSGSSWDHRIEDGAHIFYHPTNGAVIKQDRSGKTPKYNLHVPGVEDATSFSSFKKALTAVKNAADLANSVDVSSKVKSEADDEVGKGLEAAMGGANCD